MSFLKGWNRSEVLTYRMGNPEADVDVYGNPIECNYVVIVNKKDCPIIVIDEKEYIDPKGVKQAVKLSYSNTYGGSEKNAIIAKLEDRIVLKTKRYMVHDGIVYTRVHKFDKLFTDIGTSFVKNIKKSFYLDELKRIANENEKRWAEIKKSR